MKNGECPLSDAENDELMGHLMEVCRLVERVWERSKEVKPCWFGLNIGDRCYSINVKSTQPFKGVDEYIEVTKCES